MSHQGIMQLQVTLAGTEARSRQRESRRGCGGSLQVSLPPGAALTASLWGESAPGNPGGLSFCHLTQQERAALAAPASQLRCPTEADYPAVFSSQTPGREHVLAQQSQYFMSVV